MADSMLQNLLKTPRQIREEQLLKMQQEAAGRAQLGGPIRGASSALPGIFSSVLQQQRPALATDIAQTARGLTQGLGGMLGAAGYQQAGQALAQATVTPEERQAALIQDTLSKTNLNNLNNLRAARSRLENRGAPASVIMAIDDRIARKEKEISATAAATRAEQREERRLEIEEQKLKAKPIKAPQSRTRIEGDEKITEQWDGVAWSEVSRGPRYKPTTEVNIGGETIKEELAKQTVEKFGKYEDQLNSAKSSLTNLSTMENLLNEDIITGTFAKSRVAVEKALAQAGIIDGQRVANTEAFLAAAANQTIRLLETGALGSGTAVSDKDKEFMALAAGGQIELSENSIRRIIRINRQVAQESYNAYNRFINVSSERFPESGTLFGDEQYYPGQKAKLGNEIITFDPVLGWINKNGEPVQ